MSSPSWITPVRFAPRPALFRPQCATDFTDSEKGLRVHRHNCLPLQVTHTTSSVLCIYC